MDRPQRTVTEIDSVTAYPAVFLGGFGMMATFGLTRSMRASEPVVGVTPTTLPARTAALCGVAIVPFFCGVLTLFAFLRSYPVGDAVYGPFSPSAQVAVLVGQIVVPSLGGPLLGVALGRWVRFPGAGFVLFLVIFGWVNLVTIRPCRIRTRRPSRCCGCSRRSLSSRSGGRRRRHGLARVAVVLHRLAARPVRDRGPGGAAARGRGAVRSRIIRALAIAGVAAVILLVLAGTGGFTHAVTA